jgi:hypothetical protein
MSLLQHGFTEIIGQTWIFVNQGFDLLSQWMRAYLHTRARSIWRQQSH